MCWFSLLILCDKLQSFDKQYNFFKEKTVFELWMIMNNVFKMRYRPTTFNVVHHGVRANDVSIFQFTPQNAIFIPSTEEQNKYCLSGV